MAADLGIGLAIVGSFQRAGDRLRIMAERWMSHSSEVIADAKADGPRPRSSTFRIASSAKWRVRSGRVGNPQGRTPRETSSLEAYKAFTEGRVLLEALEASAIPQATAHFKHAISIDDRYAHAHVGLANASFFAYELSRASNHPDASLLASAIAHARRAIEIDRDLAESRATLAFLLHECRPSCRSEGRSPSRGAPRANVLGPPFSSRARHLGRGATECPDAHA